jgi:hypothetical protein
MEDEIVLMQNVCVEVIRLCYDADLLDLIWKLLAVVGTPISASMSEDRMERNTRRG